MESDALERAEAAWVAGNDEVVAVGAFPRPVEQRGGGPTLQVPDYVLALGALSTAAGELARLLGELRKLISTARDATVGRDLIERNIEVHIETVSEQSRKVRTLRAKYEERWRRKG